MSTRGTDTTPGNRSATPRVWLLLGQKAGDNNQVLALAEQLGWPYSVKHITSRPWELVTNLLLRKTLAGIDRRRSSPLLPPWPDLVITAGRRNEPVARWIKRRAGGHTRLVHLGRPWAPLETWDLIVTTPQYFLPEADNILHNRLPLHGITRDRLLTEGVREDPEWNRLKRPYTAILLGGDSGQFVFTPDKGRQMGGLVNDMVAQRGGSVLVTDSRRTPSDATEAFWSRIRVPGFLYSWSSPQGENPYVAYLAQADCLVVTGESMSMLAEAAATGKPLYIFDLADRKGPWWLHLHNFRYKPLSHRLAMAFGPRRMRRDIGRIQQALVAAGRARWLEEWWQSPPWPLEQGIPDSTQEEALSSARRVRALFEP